MEATPEENKEIVRRLTEAWNERDREAMGALYADELVIHGAETTVREKEAQLEGEWGFFESFPDISATTEELLAEDDTVLVRWLVTGTHDGEFANVDPTGTPVEYEEWVLYGITDGEIAEIRAQTDFLAVLQQIGAVELPT